MSAHELLAALEGPDGERLARVALNIAAEPGDVVFTGLVSQLGGREVVRALLESPDHTDLLHAVAARLDGIDPALELDRATHLDARFVIPSDAEWPTQLGELAGVGHVGDRGGVPIGLWVRGPMSLDALSTALAVVGSRSSTGYGDQVASEIAAIVGLRGIPVVSGAAFGIDYAAHRGALSAGAPTVAILACGVDRSYPAAHRPLLDHLVREHAVVSEAPLGAAPHRIRFLARNRLIAALTRGTVVVEAAARSGSLSTLRWAQRLNRITMGVPGPVTQATSEGVHHQIRLGGAALVTSGHDVLELIGVSGEDLIDEPRGPATARDRLRVKEQQVLDAVPVATPAASTSIARVAGLGLAEVQRTLIRLEEAGFVTQVGTGWCLMESRYAGGARPA